MTLQLYVIIYKSFDASSSQGQCWVVFLSGRNKAVLSSWSWQVLRVRWTAAHVELPTATGVNIWQEDGSAPATLGPAAMEKNIMRARSVCKHGSAVILLEKWLLSGASFSWVNNIIPDTPSSLFPSAITQCWKLRFQFVIFRSKGSFEDGEVMNSLSVWNKYFLVFWGSLAFIMVSFFYFAFLHLVVAAFCVCFPGWFSSFMPDQCD